MIVGPTIAEPEFEHVPVQFPDKVGRKIKAGALSLQPADEAVEPAHDRSSRHAGLLAQFIDFVERGAQLDIG